jgi:hypothetical protein
MVSQRDHSRIESGSKAQMNESILAIIGKGWEYDHLFVFLQSLTSARRRQDEQEDKSRSIHPNEGFQWHSFHHMN